jgi:hypothetical protein
LISAVNKTWKESYKRVGNYQMVINEECDAKVLLLTGIPQITLFSAIFASATVVRLAHACGLAFDNAKLQRIAGKVADIPGLRAACKLGLALTDEVLIGAAESASVPKLQWLHTEQSCELPADICAWAAKSGSINALRWLREHGSAFTADTCKSAAAGDHVHVLRFLHDEGCEWNWDACSAAARNGHLTTLQWLRERGCPWTDDTICDDAIYSGSIEMLLYLKQQGCEYTTLWPVQQCVES